MLLKAFVLIAKRLIRPAFPSARKFPASLRIFPIRKFQVLNLKKIF